MRSGIEICKMRTMLVWGWWTNLFDIAGTLKNVEQPEGQMKPLRWRLTMGQYNFDGTHVPLHTATPSNHRLPQIPEDK